MYLFVLSFLLLFILPQHSNALYCICQNDHKCPVGLNSKFAVPVECGTSCYTEYKIENGGCQVVKRGCAEKSEIPGCSAGDDFKCFCNNCGCNAVYFEEEWNKEKEKCS
ncbi:hypothetical protein M3Y94_00109300 [Aphelenchoides besseyi]|nr:hypothetical protein M3Y94_00109300 [Aphelenchoides besseyi]KAI6237521.1 hypothetical protein M3Y95_00273900 [Aphelenchoides besseyi]